MPSQGLKTQEDIKNASRAFVDGVKAAGLSEEEVEQIWLKVLSPVAAELFQGQMEDFRARVTESHHAADMKRFKARRYHGRWSSPPRGHSSMS